MLRGSFGYPGLRPRDGLLAETIPGLRSPHSAHPKTSLGWSSHRLGGYPLRSAAAKLSFWLSLCVRIILNICAPFQKAILLGHRFHGSIRIDIDSMSEHKTGYTSVENSIQIKNNSHVTCICRFFLIFKHHNGNTR